MPKMVIVLQLLSARIPKVFNIRVRDQGKERKLLALLLPVKDFQSVSGSGGEA